MHWHAVCEREDPDRCNSVRNRDNAAQRPRTTRAPRPETDVARWISLLALCLVLAACGGPAGDGADDSAVTLADSDARLRSGPAARADAPRRGTAASYYPELTYWPPVSLDGGRARISCDYDYGAHGDGERLATLEFFGVVEALQDCRERGLVRVRYAGRIDAGFTALVQRVGEIADRMEIGTRILDIDSAGGHVEEAIKAGDRIGESDWRIWVRRDSLCHSACVLILAAGDQRTIDGKVGIHRLMRDRSTASTRAELSAELAQVNGELRQYLARNGAAETLADLMMTVPNRSLRLLRPEELDLYGLQGTNPVEDDLNRIRVARKCGEDFARRRDAFQRAFDEQCMATGKAFGTMASCGVALYPRFGFPDPDCPDGTPLAGLPQPRPADALMAQPPAGRASATD